jgi:ubiquitin carboxyl-terminal hydrolase 34
VKTSSSRTIPNAEPLVKRLFFFIDAAQKIDQIHFMDVNVQILICQSFSVLIEASVCQQSFWEVTKQHTQFGNLIFSLLLEEKRPSIRRQIAEKIKVICGSSKTQKKTSATESADEDVSTPENSTVLEIIATVWDAFVQSMQLSVQYADQSQEFFSVALVVIQSITERSPYDIVFTEYISHWSEVMLSHKTQEVRFILFKEKYH